MNLWAKGELDINCLKNYIIEAGSDMQLSMILKIFEICNKILEVKTANL